MRKTIVVGTFLAAFGFAAVAQASDRQGMIDRDGVSTIGEVSRDSRSDRHEQYERKYRTRDDRHDGSRERSRERHHSREQHDRR